MKTRMQPIGNVWNKFPRIVRDLALAAANRCASRWKASETELDKTIIEAIKDPLTHVVRNSVDHGIETPEAARAAGKPAEGCCPCAPSTKADRSTSRSPTMAAGIDLERVKQKAIERGL